MKGTIKKTLKNIGLSEKESEVYIFLGKKGPLKSSELSKQLKINKGQIYRTLKNLQTKGLIESTLEYPTRFTSVPFEKVIDSFIKSKREEVDQIEESKNELLTDWKKISQTQLESSLERFSVIEGEKKIFQKISQMINETKKQFVSISSVFNLLKADHYGIFENILNHPLHSTIKFRFLTQLSKNHLKPLKVLLSKMKSGPDFKGRDPQRSSSIFPRMVIKDNEEILLFISDENGQSSTRQIEAVLSTNCRSIIKSFNSVFKELWNNSQDLEKRIIELETGKQSPVMELIKDSKTANKLYFDKLNSAKREILIVTTSNRLIGLAKNFIMLKNLYNKGIKIKIMAPLTCENLEATQNLLEFSEVKHIPLGYRETTIIDGKSLFQLNYPVFKEHKDNEALNFENVFFTNNSEYIKQTSKNLLDAWIKTRTPSNMTLHSIIGQTMLPKNEVEWDQITTTMQRISVYKNMNNQKVTEETVLNEIKHQKRYTINGSSRNNVPEVTRSFGSVGVALIHPPPQLNLPEFIIATCMFDDESSFGATNHLVVFTKNKTSFDSIFEPVAVVDTNPNVIDYRKMVFNGNPVQSNIRLVKGSEFQIFVQGNTLFAGWTSSIPLLSGNYVLPPSCILFEGYGVVKSGFFKNIFLSHRLQEAYFNRLDAFVTYFHPSMKYTCPGTEGFLDRETVFTSSSLGQNQKTNIK